VIIAIASFFFEHRTMPIVFASPSARWKRS
jgi:hypothetical protein